MEILEILRGVLMYIFMFIAVFGIPAAAVVFFIIYLVKYKKCSPEETDKKKTFKTCCITFGVMGGTFIISVIALLLLFAASIAYM